MDRLRPTEPHHGPRFSSGRIMVSALSALALAACGGDAPRGSGQMISSETFVEAMVELRTSPQLEASGYLPEGEPERILEARGLEPDDLRRFVETHGLDVPLMASLWEEIDRRVSEARTVNLPES